MALQTTAWIIGDVHGCLLELLALEALVSRRADRLGHRPYFVLAGDLIDRGPASMEVVSHVMRGVEIGTHAAIVGNHEEFFLRALCNGRPDLVEAAGCEIPLWLETLPAMFVRRPRLESLARDAEWAVFHRLMWMTQGGAETLASYGCDPLNPLSWVVPLEHIRFLGRLELRVQALGHSWLNFNV